jgi:hypothetical protein
MMFTRAHFLHLRYVLLTNMIIALVPAMSVKGRANDPLLHASWWSFNQHSAVLVVAAAAILGSALVLALARLNVRSRWAFIACGLVVGIFPATFYLLSAPDAAAASLPLADMYSTGAVCGVIGGFVLSALRRTEISPRTLT